MCMCCCGSTQSHCFMEELSTLSAYKVALKKEYAYINAKEKKRQKKKKRTHKTEEYKEIKYRAIFRENVSAGSCDYVSKMKKNVKAILLVVRKPKKKRKKKKCPTTEERHAKPSTWRKTR